MVLGRVYARFDYEKERVSMGCRKNTAIERVVDDISGDKRELAKQAKDTASAAVALSAIAVGLAWVIIIHGILW